MCSSVALLSYWINLFSMVDFSYFAAQCPFPLFALFSAEATIE